MTESFAVYTLHEGVRLAFEREGFSIGALLDVQATAQASNPTPLADDLEHLTTWLAQGAHAGMEFMERNREAREDPRRILPSVRSALIVLAPYATGARVRSHTAHTQSTNTALTSTHAELRSAELQPDSPPDPLPDSLLGRGLIARYARGKDYHKALKRRLDRAAQEVRTQMLACGQSDFEARPLVDSVPFLERAHGRAAQLGFVGKNTMLIRPGVGSYFFIATVLFSLPAEALGAPVGRSNHKNIESNKTINNENSNAHPITTLTCGTCRKCLDACPTQAFAAPGVLDARRCLSYLSIEHRGTVEPEFLPHFKNTLYGCDICQEVCPYNFVTQDLVTLLEFKKPHQPFSKVTATDLACMTPVQYEQWFGGTAATRAKYGGLVRNALYHLFATNDCQLARILTSRTNDSDALIRAAVAQLQALSGQQT